MTQELCRHEEYVYSIKRYRAKKGPLHPRVKARHPPKANQLPQPPTPPLPPRHCAGAAPPGAWRGSHRPGLPSRAPAGPRARHEGNAEGTCRRRRRVRPPRWRHFGVPAGGGGGVVLPFAVGSLRSAPFRRRYECGGARTRDGGRRAPL